MLQRRRNPSLSLVFSCEGKWDVGFVHQIMKKDFQASHTHVELSPHFILLDLQATGHMRSWLRGLSLVCSYTFFFFHYIQKWLRRYDGKRSSSCRKKRAAKWKMTEIHSSRVRADTQTSYCVKLLHGTRLPPESSLHSAVAFTKPGLTWLQAWENGRTASLIRSLASQRCSHSC